MITLRLAFGDESRDVTLRPTKDGADAIVQGRTLQLDVRLLGGASYLFVHGDRCEAFHCVRDGDAVHLFWRGRAYELRLSKEGSPTVHRHVPGALEAPMPGKVTKLSVQVGQQVKKGEEILVVEAMKMENQVRAPKDGRVASLSAQVGDMVAPGMVLAEIE